mmetsp:Transcript_49792/g.90152  ORF Transcript_49792/g.90152 Transcript_49792/m.90152 type:complete len:174 (-) Transcript_49792:25-546(-)
MNSENPNFIDKTFTVLASILVKVFPTTSREKEAFSYYRTGMSAQSSGNYMSALENYCEALKLEEDLIDRSYILYNIGLIFANTGNYNKAMLYYVESLELNPELSQANNNLAILYHYKAKTAIENCDWDTGSLYFELARYHFKQTLAGATTGYNEVYNWLRLTQGATRDYSSLY